VAERRDYGEGCAVAHGLDLIGERWSLLIVRELLLGPKRFNALQDGILRVGANALSQRLHHLRQAGIVDHRRLGPPTNAQVWELTDWGRRLEPIILSIGGWASSSPLLDPDGWFSPDALMLHLKARSEGDAALPPGRYQVRIADDTFAISAEPGSLRVVRGECEDPDATVEADLRTLTRVVKNRESFHQAVADGRLVAHGDQDAALDLLTRPRATPPSGNVRPGDHLT
jgi:DNA-binding HxlR family transcriptional regulator